MLSFAQRLQVCLLVRMVTLWMCLVASPTAFGLTRIDFISDAGDWVGAGQTFSLTPSDGNISLISGASAVRVRFTGPGPSPKTFWDLEFAPVAGASLVPGNYASAQRASFKSPQRPGLDIGGDGRGCNTLTGTFTIHEAVFDSGGNAVAFAADAEQHCEGAAAALRVRVRVNSNVPVLLQTPQAIAGVPQEVYEQTLVNLNGTQSYDPDGRIVEWQWSQVAGPVVLLESPNQPVTLFRAPSVGIGGADLRFRLLVRDDAGHTNTGTVDIHVFDQRDRRTLLIWRSSPGDYIGGGVPLIFTSADGSVVVEGGGYGMYTAFQGATFNNWTLIFDGPMGSLLDKGRYVLAPGVPNAPTLNIFGSGRGCSADRNIGEFTVLELDDPTATTQFGARFVQGCEGSVALLRGSVLINAIAPGNPVARIARLALGEPGATVSLDGTASSSTGSELVSYRWRQLSGPPVELTDPTSPITQFVMPPGAGVPLRFELEVTDEDGLVNVATTDRAVSAPIVQIPTLSPAGLVVLILIFAVAGRMLLHSKRG